MELLPVAIRAELKKTFAINKVRCAAPSERSGGYLMLLGRGELATRLDLHRVREALERNLQSMLGTPNAVLGR